MNIATTINIVLLVFNFITLILSIKSFILNKELELRKDKRLQEEHDFKYKDLRRCEEEQNKIRIEQEKAFSLGDRDMMKAYSLDMKEALEREDKAREQMGFTHNLI